MTMYMVKIGIGFVVGRYELRIDYIVKGWRISKGKCSFANAYNRVDVLEIQEVATVLVLGYAEDGVGGIIIHTSVFISLNISC